MEPKNISVDIRRCKCRIYREVLEHLGYKITAQTHDPEANVVWWDGSIPIDEYSTISPEQHVNKIPGMDVLCYKSTLFQALNNMQSSYPLYYNFFPKTFLLPNQFHEFQKEHQKVMGRLGESPTWIVKPRSGCCGVGIHLVQNSFDLAHDPSPSIIQRYISPFLVESHKFDFRFYLLITDLNPFSLYIYKEGIARFCTEAYQPPTRNNLNDKFMHITNTAINVENNNKNDEFDFTRLASRVIASVCGNDKEKISVLWNKIKNVSLLTIVALFPQIISSVISTTYASSNSSVTNKDNDSDATKDNNSVDASKSHNSSSLSNSVNNNPMVSCSFANKRSKPFPKNSGKMPTNKVNNRKNNDKSNKSSDSNDDNAMATNSNDNQNLHRFFHMLGIDIMINDSGDPVVLELNDNPSMKITFSLESILKPQLLKDELKLVNMVSNKCSNSTKNNGDVENGENEVNESNGWQRLHPLPSAVSAVNSSELAVSITAPSTASTSTSTLIRNNLRNSFARNGPNSFGSGFGGRTGTASSTKEEEKLATPQMKKEVEKEKLNNESSAKKENGTIGENNEKKSGNANDKEEKSAKGNKDAKSSESKRDKKDETKNNKNRNKDTKNEKEKDPNSKSEPKYENKNDHKVDIKTSNKNDQKSESKNDHNKKVKFIPIDNDNIKLSKADHSIKETKESKITTEDTNNIDSSKAESVDTISAEVKSLEIESSCTESNNINESRSHQNHEINHHHHSHDENVATSKSLATIHNCPNNSSVNNSKADEKDPTTQSQSSSSQSQNLQHGNQNQQDQQNQNQQQQQQQQHCCENIILSRETPTMLATTSLPLMPVVKSVVQRALNQVGHKGASLISQQTARSIFLPKVAVAGDKSKQKRAPCYRYHFQ